MTKTETRNSAKKKTRRGMEEENRRETPTEGTREATMEATRETTLEATQETTMEATRETTMEATREITMDGVREAITKEIRKTTKEAVRRRIEGSIWRAARIKWVVVSQRAAAERTRNLLLTRVPTKVFSIPTETAVERAWVLENNTRSTQQILAMLLHFQPRLNHRLLAASPQLPLKHSQPSPLQPPKNISMEASLRREGEEMVTDSLAAQKPSLLQAFGTAIRFFLDGSRERGRSASSKELPYASGTSPVFA
ncbi:hypothetical protein B0T22DRAFT_111558 [Podospora appendiculata]|uniref:Uncharacterized protein n=1 Tax=Podospora appendiculata TaxID=314037 RepID=A0AAE0XLC5_9PEZI|nr:hypothetical protein B0T22DRAFT_111558 [Podospora appendiculata]